jgi:hypothetical protein
VDNSIPYINIIRKYSDNFLSYGFTYSEENDIHLPVYLICGEKISNSSMVPVDLNCHSSSKHPNQEKKARSIFEKLLSNRVY